MIFFIVDVYFCRSTWYIQPREGEFGQGTAVQFGRKKCAEKIKRQSRWMPCHLDKLFPRQTFLRYIILTKKKCNK